MNDSALFNEIIAKLRTTSEASDLTHYLEGFSGATSSVAKNLEDQKNLSRLPKEVPLLLNQAFTKQSPTPEEQILIKRTANELLDKLRTCKTIILTIAFQPDDVTISFFSDWIKKNVNPTM